MDSGGVVGEIDSAAAVELVGTLFAIQQVRTAAGLKRVDSLPAMEFRRDAQVGRAGDRVAAVPPEDPNLRGGTRDVIAVVEAVGDDVWLQNALPTSNRFHSITVQPVKPTLPARWIFTS